MSRPPIALRAGEYRVTAAPGSIAIHGLGSCVAVFLYDPGQRIGGMAHVLLPAPPAGSRARPGRYAPTAVNALVEESILLGARRAALLAKVTGGSSMFNLEAHAPRPPIGEKNVQAVLRALSAAGVRVAASDVGGGAGRSVLADLTDGSLTIRTIRGEPRIL